MKERGNTYTFRCDPDFSPERTGEYDFVFQVTRDSCSFSVFDPGKERYIGIGEAEIPLEQLRGEVPWIGKPTRSVTMILENHRSTLVPAELFEEEEKEAYFNLVLDEKDDEVILADHIDSLDMITIYGVGEQLLEQVTGIFPHAVVRHISGVLIESILMNFNGNLVEKKIFLDVRSDMFSLLLFGDRKLLFSNAFPIGAPEDLLYYLLFVMAQQELSPEIIPVSLMGKVTRDSRLFELLNQYIRHVDFVPRNGSVNFSPVFDDLPGHAYYTLLNPLQ